MFHLRVGASHARRGEDAEFEPVADAGVRPREAVASRPAAHPAIGEAIPAPAPHQREVDHRREPEADRHPLERFPELQTNAQRVAVGIEGIRQHLAEGLKGRERGGEIPPDRGTEQLPRREKNRDAGRIPEQLAPQCASMRNAPANSMPSAVSS